MTWLTKLRIHLGHDEACPVTPDPKGVTEALDAVESAKIALGEAMQRRNEIREVGKTLDKIKRRNHIGEAIYLSMLGKEKDI